MTRDETPPEATEPPSRNAGESGAQICAWRRDAVATLSALDLDPEAGWGRVEWLSELDPALERIGDGSELEGSRLLHAAGIALGAVLVRELILEWSEAADEPILYIADSDVVLYPVRMVRSHLLGARRDRTPVQLERLVSSTASYLDHLVRYFPSRLGLARRSRGSRRASPKGSPAGS